MGAQAAFYNLRVMNASRHKSITSIQRYDLHREALEENSILTLNYNDNTE